MNESGYEVGDTGTIEPFPGWFKRARIWLAQRIAGRDVTVELKPLTYTVDSVIDGELTGFRVSSPSYEQKGDA